MICLSGAFFIFILILELMTRMLANSSKPKFLDSEFWRRKVFFVAGSDDNSDVAGRFFVNYATSSHDCIDLLDILSIRSGGLCHMLSHLGRLATYLQENFSSVDIGE
ncbi:hypothetical protein TIFTF001_017419 [Ficus carica]|uniref:Uncharacterized protein n=1 Tax=Ficus carica TaxID=3494 RepID=A0AA88A962_FICCA|nr:hypothetical protein TIFTF001_017419 [Ficus carica]